MEAELCRCGQIVPEQILTVAPDIRICPDCRSACIDRKVMDRGLDALNSIPPIVKNGESYCIRDFRSIEPLRAATGVKTCLACQCHLDRLAADLQRKIASSPLAHVKPLYRGDDQPGSRRRRQWRVEANP